jgi:ElaB/YqjD/DUF883 family membrane-anchored ribosome-binding protein
MEQKPDPQTEAEKGKDHLKAAADNFKAAATVKAEEIRKAAEQKAEEIRAAAEEKAKQYRGQAETAWSDARTKAKYWQTEGEAYVRDNPGRAVLVALGVGFVLGLLFRK